jgi:hypothetical protein
LLIFGNLFFTQKGIKSLFPSMSKLLLLIQTEADVTHLEAAAKAILGSAITGVWVVFSPAITVNASEAAQKLDTEVAALRTAERQAADRGDYAAAAGYKTQREGKELDRAKAIRDAWKTATAEERQAKTKGIFEPFLALLRPNGINAKISSHSDHYDREQWVAMLNSLSGVWFKEFSAGGFMVAWPEAVVASIRAAVSPAVEAFKESKAADATAGVVREPIKAAAPKTRYEEILALHPMKLGPLMRSLGLDPEGKSRTQKIQEILAAEEKATAPAPELAEY